MVATNGEDGVRMLLTIPKLQFQHRVIVNCNVSTCLATDHILKPLDEIFYNTFGFLGEVQITDEVDV